MASSRKPPAEGEVDFGRYTVQLTKELGRGTFGSVYEGRDKRSGRRVAAKKMTIKSDQHGADGMKEIKLLDKMTPHENIVKLEDFFYFDTSFWIIMEYCGAGDLDAYMAANDLALKELLRIMYQCAAAVTHMHEQANPIIHRDIKPANILMTVAPGNKVTVKLTDLGVSTMIDPEVMMKTAMFSTVVGTPGYMAPEQYERRPYGMAVDVFALGLVFLAMVMYKRGPNAHLLPLADSGPMVMPIGQDMMMKAAMKQPQTPVTSINAKDPAEVKKVKELVLGMVQYSPSSRTAIRRVMTKLAKVIGISAPAPAAAPPRAMSRLPTPPGSDDESSSDEDGRTSSSTASRLESLTLKSGRGIGFALVQAAAAEVLAEKLREEQRRREKAKVAAAEGLLEGLDAIGRLLQALGGEDKFAVGDKVVVDTDLERAKRLQVNHGGWVDGMKMYLGLEGTVTDSGLGTFRVKFPDGVTVTWNAELLTAAVAGTPLKKPPYAKGRVVDAMARFCQYDLVEVIADAARFRSLQEQIGVWKDNAMAQMTEERGIVTRIDSDGDIEATVMVEASAIKCVFHPDSLVKVAAPSGPIEAGDVVFIKCDQHEVMKLQKKQGGWQADMAQALGNLTMVEEMKLDDQVAEVEVDGQKWDFNVKALVLLAKAEEVLMVLLRQKKAVAAAVAAPSRRRDEPALPLPPPEKKSKGCSLM